MESKKETVQSKDTKPKTNEQKTPIWQYKAFDNWVRSVMLADIVEPNQTVLELCGDGSDVGKWGRAKIKKMTVFGKSPNALTQYKERWESKGKPFEADFHQIDIFQDNISAVDGLSSLQMDHVVLFSELARNISDTKSLEALMSNVSQVLKPGGFFFGIVPDSSVIWY